MTYSKALIISVLFFSFSHLLKANGIVKDVCNPITVTVQESDLNAKSIEIDLNGLDMKDVTINLIKPKGQRILDAKSLSFNNLESGLYIIVVTGRSESDDYCPTSINISIE